MPNEIVEVKLAPRHLTAEVRLPTVDLKGIE